MKRVFIIHGWDGFPEENWFQWLVRGLEAKGFQVSVPQMPDAGEPVIEKWLAHLAEVVGVPDSDTYFVGHSIGCQAILRYLDSYRFGPLEKVGGAVFVAGWFNAINLEDEEAEEIIQPWLKNPINLEKIKTVLPKASLIISDNDPYDCFEENKKKFAEIGCKIIELHNAGHINTAAGFTELPVALEELLKISHAD